MILYEISHIIQKEKKAMDREKTPTGSASDASASKSYTNGDFLRYALRILPAAYLIGVLGTLLFLLRGFYL